MATDLSPPSVSDLPTGAVPFNVHNTGPYSLPPPVPPGDAYQLYQLRAGIRLGPCVTIRPLGRGGMGEVWLARNEQDDRDEAVKVLLTVQADEEGRRRFTREAKAAMQLFDCREIVRTYDIGEVDGRLYIRMEYVRGTSLDRHAAPTVGELYPVFKRMAAALAVGHKRGIVHRDVKPSNFMLTDGGLVKLMDFGLARPAGASTLTVTAATLGTPVYMSPEQWSAARDVDARADVYSLGVSFYRLLMGRVPFDSSALSNPQAFQVRVATEDPLPSPPLRGVPAQLPNLIYKAMAKRPAERFADALEVLEALERIERDPDHRIEAPLTEKARQARARAARVAVAVLAFF
ncbi:MAG TPA: serine/threonine-protein kinase, partial [Planctomycetota bacterium]|nr:serine/threonine-protein kinase [Planctomycetota bacterium]